jgi:hypothetical protein
MLRRIQEKILVNNPAELVLDDSIADQIEFKGYGIVKAVDLLAFDTCCASAGVEQVDQVTIVIPAGACDCPYEPLVEIRANQGDMLSVFGGPIQKYEQYSGLNADGSTPTATQAATNIFNAINDNPYSIVTATNPSAGFVLITEKDATKTNGFRTYVTGGTVLNDGTGASVLHVKAILTADDMARLFPIKWGMAGSRPELPISGATYCKWSMHIRSAAPDQQNIDMDRAYVHSDREVDFYLLSAVNGVAVAAYATALADVNAELPFISHCGIDY